MNKRNTEGYVLAYLLIVIAVMGAIAATLMTSTVQVMAAQQNSIRYMQDKYAAMGEIEKLVAELDAFSHTRIAQDDSIDYYSQDPVVCYADATNYLWQFVIPSFDSQFSTLDMAWDASNNSLFITSVIPDNSVQFNTSLLIFPNITTPSTEKPREVPKFDPETHEPTGETEIIYETWYTYSIDITNINYSSYELSSVVEGGDT